ncbi:hypothetical protein ACIQK6_38235 [Streptomyces sp. NPDC091682]|uniref:hypothetical protein n=1 Tax=Streptomyces sp. NPDC091682 TaxID=3366005 RepID=UPI00380E01FA
MTVQSLPSQDDVRATAARLYRLADSNSAWLASAEGADLWVDGQDALLRTPVEMLQYYIHSFEILVDRLRSHDAFKGGMVDLFEALQAHVVACTETLGKPGFMHSLAHALCVARSVHAAPLTDDLEIVNDSLLMVLSRSYRLFRFNAYNSGVTIRYAADGWPAFHPESGRLVVARRYTPDLNPRRVQQYNVNHDMMHVVLFGDCYVRASSEGCRATARRLVLAEEASIALDLRIYRELARYGVRLHHLGEIEATESGWRPDGYHSVFAEIAPDPAESERLEIALKRAAVDSVQSGGLPCPTIHARLQDWVASKAIASHAQWSRATAERNHSPAFRAAVDAIPSLDGQSLRLDSAAFENWSGTDRIPVDSRPPCEEDRARALRRNEFMALAVKVGEWASRSWGDRTEAAVGEFSRRLSCLFGSGGLPFQDPTLIGIIENQVLPAITPDAALADLLH